MLAFSWRMCWLLNLLVALKYSSIEVIISQICMGANEQGIWYF